MAEYINSQSVNVITSKQVLENVFSPILHFPGKGVTEALQEELAAKYIRMIRPKVTTGTARQIGATVNGGNFNSASVVQPESEEFNLELTYVYDACEDIPSSLQGMVPYDLMSVATKHIAGKLSKMINASTLASQIVAALNHTAVTSTDCLVSLPSTITTGSYLTAIMTASENLDNGDTTHGVDQFEANEREIIGRPSFITALFTSSNIIAGGSNYAQEMLAAGTISPNTYLNNGQNYKGEVAGMPCYFAPSAVWTAAETWINVDTAATTGEGATPASTAALTTGALAKIEAVVCAAMGTYRGLLMGGIKSVDSPTGQGTRLQPLYRWGVETIYAKSVNIIAKNAFSNPAVYTTGAYVTSLSMQAPGSRA